MSRTRKLHDAYEWSDDEDDESETGVTDIIHAYVEPEGADGAFAELDELLMNAGEASHILVPVETARRILFKWLTEDDQA